MKIKVRFPNESYFVEINNFNGNKFKPKSIFKDEVFGKYFGMTISVPRDEYELKLKKKSRWKKLV